MQKTLSAADYARAEQMLPHNRSKLVRGAQVRPGWLADGTRFWYRTETADGRRFVVVDPRAGTRQDAFDHGRLAAALSEASGTAFDGGRLPFASIDLGDDGVEFDAAGTRWRYADGVCTKADDRHPVAMGELPSPDGKWVAFTRDHNIRVRAADGSAEFALTTDGEEYHDYGSNLDVALSQNLMRNIGVTMPPMAVWSPDSTRLLTHRTDQRHLPGQVLVEAAPRGGGRPVEQRFRYAMPTDEEHATLSFAVLDIDARTVVHEQGEPSHIGFLSPVALNWVRWSADGSGVHFLRAAKGLKTLSMHRLDPETGATTTLVSESSATRVDPSAVIMDKAPARVLDSGEVIWFSQRDGWGHLYLYGADGTPAGRITGGEWLVSSLLHVDEQARTVFFMASGLVKDDPYARQLCRVGLDGTGFTRLTDDDLHHEVTASPSGEVFLDSASTVDTPPVTVVRDISGTVLVEVERADVTALAAEGWTAPERFTVKAADGVTDIHGILWRPHGFDPAQRYPVIDNPYPGPQLHRVESGFTASFTGPPEAMAALGFAVVAVDGRGTPGRSEAFRNHSYGDLSGAGTLEDHIAAIRQLAVRHPWLDTDRVGVFGISGGGFATGRAMLAHGDFYKVGVALAGNHDMRYYLAAWTEWYLGDLNDESLRGTSNPELAGNLTGKLLLVHGELDDNVLPHLTTRLVDALIEADKDFDLLIVPGVEHSFHGRMHYVLRRQWDYFVRHLHGTEPPAGRRVKPFPVDMEMLMDLLG
ncbi:DPP IV N-terminal domain-containing protein [Streptomyces sp. NPDC055078]